MTRSAMMRMPAPVGTVDEFDEVAEVAELREHLAGSR